MPCPMFFNWYNLKNAFSSALDFDSIDLHPRFRSFCLRFIIWNQACAHARTLEPMATSVAVLPSATSQAMAATVNGEGVTAAEYAAELARYKSAQQALNKNVSDTDASKTVLEDLIAQVLLEQGAKAAGYEISDSVLQSRVDALTSQLGGADKLSQWNPTTGIPMRRFERI